MAKPAAVRSVTHLPTFPVRLSTTIEDVRRRSLGSPHALLARWWMSLYGRVALSFVVLVLFLVFAQSLIFSYRLQRSSVDAPDRAPANVAVAAAWVIGRHLEAFSTGDLERFVTDRFGHERAFYLVTREGRVIGVTPEPLAPEILDACRMLLLGNEWTAVEGRPQISGPVAIAPVQANGVLAALVVMPPPGRDNFRDILRVVSIPNVLLLVVATTAAAVMIVSPARRRLHALEHAAMQMGAGDLSARASVSGRDEVATVARAFNAMGDALASRDAQIRSADRLRRQMLADVSHELRTPLTSMRGYLETLQMEGLGADPERHARYLATVSGETLRMERLVNDLITLARYESGSVAINPQVTAIRQVFALVIRRHERAASERRIEFHLNVSDPADQLVLDPIRIDQVIDNLVSNALRYVPDGGVIELTARQITTGVQLAVIDSGSGIAPEHLPHVFERFYNADPARARVMGSGLGLSIVRAIVEAHGGQVRVESRPGRTAFVISFPIATVADNQGDPLRRGL